jgi:two-component system nitrate/nitrite sensor histidine kinase NarX
MQNYLSRGDTEKLKESLQANYRTLSDAYIDARQAIENLRRAPTSELRDWISQVASDYELATNQKISVNMPVFSVEYPANVQAQLIRIVQEALSNIRKHANAKKVEINGTFDGDLILIKIQDDGYGFSPESVEGRSRYGLRGMRERAESIGADFQITSQPGQGTIVSLRMPVIVKEQS